MMNQTDGTKCEVLKNLKVKIATAQAQVEKAQGAVSELTEEIKTRLKSDATGAGLYDPEELRKDRLELVKRERAMDFAVETLATLQAVLPEVHRDAVIEEMSGINEGLADMDVEKIAPELERFRLAWNSMAEAFSSVESLFVDCNNLERQFRKLAESIGSKEHFVQGSSSRNRLHQVVGDAMGLFLDRTPERRTLAEGSLRRKAKEEPKADAAPECQPEDEEPSPEVPEMLAQPVGETARWSRVASHA